MRTLIRVAALAAIVSAPVFAQQATQAAAPAAPAQVVPAVGEMAPDFTAPVAGKDGIAKEPVTLSKLRGKVVVLAFYPADRTSGCTAEMTKFTNEYATLFGDGVVVLPISRDSLGSHASWAKDMGMPFQLVSDTGFTVAKLYGSLNARNPRGTFARNVIIVGKDGKIAHTITPLNAFAEDAYTALAAAVAAAKK